MDLPQSSLSSPEMRHLVACGETLRELRVWSESRWDRTPERDRPRPARHCPGLGWVVTVPLGFGD
jgi:hypothetical protein